MDQCNKIESSAIDSSIYRQLNFDHPAFQQKTEYFCDFEMGKDFLDKIPKKLINWNSSKVNHSSYHIKQENASLHASEAWRNDILVYISQRVLPKIYKE